MAKFEYTKEHIKSSKLALLISAITAGVADIFVTVLLMIAGLWGYIALPIILAVADIAFLVVALFTNFRFRYSITYTATYLAVFLGCVLGHFLVIRGGAETAMTAVALIVWVVVHILNFIVVLLGAKGAVTKQKGHHFVTALLVIVFIGSVGAYIGFGSSEGYFGQGSLTARPITFVYDEKTDSYTATGVLDGSGKFAIIPEKFDGKPVRAIDATIFSANRLDRVEIQTGAGVELLNLDAVSEITVQEITAQRDTLTTLQREFYTAYRDGDKNEALLTLASISAPSDLADDEIYITFTYTETALDCIGETFLPSWIGHKGDRFDLSSLADNIEYIINTDTTDEALLHELYTSQKQGSGYILLPLMLDAKTPLNGTVIQKSHKNVTVDFEKIYRVEILEDNDTLYTMPESFTSITVNGESVGYRYVTPSTIASLLPSNPAREGFTVAWDYGYGNGFTLPEETTSPEALLAALDGREESKFTVKPEWTMQKPSISAPSTNSTNGSFTYGDRVVFDILATAPAQGTVLSYDWYYGNTTDGTYLATTKNYEIPVILMEQAGQYSVKVTASSDTVTSLTSEVSVSTRITVQRKEIDITWNGIDDLSYVREYDSFYHNIGISYNEDDLVTPTGASRDTFTFEFSHTSIKNAGSYEVTIALTGDAQTKYVLRANDMAQTYQITQKPVTIEWQNLTLTYNADAQKPSATITAGICDGDSVLVVVTQASEKTVVGTYEAEAILDNENYKIAETNLKQFTILRKDITISWASQSSYTYNKTEQGPDPSTTGIEAKDLSAGIKLTRVGAGKDAGTYTVGVTINSDNYRIVTEGSTMEYTIAPKTLSVDWKASSLVYTATKQYPTNSLVGIIDGDTVTLSYEIADSLGATNVGTYTVIATSQNKNYTLDTTHRHTYDIIKATVHVEWSNNTLTYAHKNLLPSYTIVGLLGNDTYGESAGHSIIVSVAGAQMNVCENATITMSYTSDNYEIEALSLSSTLTITKKEVTLAWTNNSFVYNAAEQLPTVTIADGQITGDTVEVVASGAQTVPGGYEATATLTNDNYVIKAGQNKYTFTIKKKSLTPEWDNLTFTYDSTAKNPTVTLTGIMDADLTKVEFALSTPQTNAGTHTAKVTLTTMTDCYELSSTDKKFTIEQAVLTPNWTNLQFVYDATAHQPIVTFDGIQGMDTVNFEFDIAAQKNAGSHEFTIVLKNANYKLTSGQKNTMVIEQAELVVSWTNNSFEYNGKTQYPTYQFFGLLGTDTAQETTSQAGKNAGTYQAVLTIGNKNYKVVDTASLTYDYEITKKELVINWGNDTFTFNNTERFPEYTITGIVSGEYETNLGATKTTQRYAGDYTVSYNITNTNYVVTNPSTTLHILKLQVSPTWTKTSFVYNGSLQKPTYTLPQVAGYSYTVTPSIEGVRDVQYGAEFSISTDDANVEIIDGKTTFDITPREITVNWGNTSLTYNGKEQAPTASTSGILTVDKDTVFLTVTGLQISAEQNLIATVSINSDNYTIKSGTETKTFSIAKKKISISWSTNQFTYNGNAQAPTASIPTSMICEGDTVNINYLSAQNTEAGDYTMNIELDNPNYEIQSGQSSKTYTIAPYAVTVTWGNTVFTYNGQLQVPTASALGLGGEELISTVTGGEINARPGEPYTATAVCLNTNYKLNNPTCKFTINPAELPVTWNAGTYTYTSNPQSPTATVTPLSGDVAPLSYSYKNAQGQSVTNPTNAGTYTVTVLTSNTNYAVSSNTKTYTIEKAKISVHWNGTTAEYTGSAKTPTAVAQGVNGKSLSFTYTYYYNGQKVSSAVQAGVYTVVVTLTNSADQNNYELENATLTNFVITAGSN